LSLGGDEPSHEAVIQYAYDQDVCVIAATGNDYSSDPHYPGANGNVLAVGALEPNLTRAEFSNHGPAFNKFVMAPGVDIASTYKGNDYVYLQGTSMAAPFVTGLSALLLSYAKRNGKSLKPDEVFRIIRETATPLGTGKGDFFCGEGLVNAKAALDKTSELF
jgi:subtilisin family serine protease